MKSGILLLFIMSFFCPPLLWAQQGKVQNPLVNYDAFETLVKQAKIHRKTHLVNLDQFLALSKESAVMILDTRSDTFYNRKHIAGAIHLNFSDFTQKSLAALIPSFDTKVLIYCNNNFSNDEANFPTKAATPKIAKNTHPLTLALNIPTYITLYGYGYRNIYELAELIDVNDERLRYEGTEVDNNDVSATGEVIIAMR